MGLYFGLASQRPSRPLVAHLVQGRHIPGILILNERMNMGETIEELLLIAEEGIPSAYQDCITYLPVT